VTTSVEHKAVLHTCQVLERRGFEVTYLPVDRFGRVDPAAVDAAITEHTTLVSVGYANNEIGTVQPVAEIGAICRERRVVFHTDAVQAAAYLPIDVDALNVSLMSLGAHKLGGPKGIGALFVRHGTQLLPQIQGGSQERQRRAGTESVALSVGFARAMELTHGDSARREAENARQQALRDRLIEGVGSLPGARLTGHAEERLPNSASFVIDGLEGGDLVAALDLDGIAASTGSACTSGNVEPSHVLLAIGIPPRLAHGSLRLTLGERTTADEIERAIERVAACVDRLQSAVGVRPAVASAG
jgi:cysteine desulfurase